MNMTIEWGTRLCTVKGESGYFHTWEHYSKPLPASPLVGGEPAGVFSQVFGIVEFKDGIRRVDPTTIVFRDEENDFLNKIDEEMRKRIIEGQPAKPESNKRLPDKYRNDILDLLTHSDAVTCTATDYEPMFYASKALYEVPNSHRVVIDYNKMAKVLYDAGYRKAEIQ